MQWIPAVAINQVMEKVTNKMQFCREGNKFIFKLGEFEMLVWNESGHIR